MGANWPIKNCILGTINIVSLSLYKSIRAAAHVFIQLRDMIVFASIVFVGFCSFLVWERLVCEKTKTKQRREKKVFKWFGWMPTWLHPQILLFAIFSLLCNFIELFYVQNFCMQNPYISYICILYNKFYLSLLYSLPCRFDVADYVEMDRWYCCWRVWGWWISQVGLAFFNTPSLSICL